MAEIINLRMARKAKSRAESARNAAKNRAEFGVPKSEINLTSARRDAGGKHLDGHKRDVKRDLPDTP
jgi:Domain of unknown function (DUF4169)